MGGVDVQLHEFLSPQLTEVRCMRFKCVQDDVVLGYGLDDRGFDSR